MQEWEQMTFAPDIWCGKMCPEHLVATKAKTSEPYLKKLQELRIKPPQFLDLRGDGGQQAAASWQTGGALLGEYTMRSFGECPSVENVSRLSQILTDNPHPKYFLSARACAGILRRAENGGKELPPMLKEALMKQSAFLNAQDVRGGVKEYSYNMNEPERCQRSTINQCFNISGEDIAGTLDASYYKGIGARSGKEREVVAFGISAYESNAMKSNNPHSGIYEADTARTLDNNGGSPACNQGGIAICYNKQRCDKFAENNVASTMSARQYKDESDVVVDGRGNGNIAPTLTGDHENRITDYTAIVLNDQGGTQMSVTSVDCRNMRENPEINGTLQAKESGFSYNLQNVCRTGAAVRRLTPLECERLQGYPSGWTDIGDWIDSKGKLHRSEQNDSARYKALGNSIALPFWQWLAERICKQYDRQATMASLFDGIGGFPLVFGRAGAVPVWSSEIEEFPIAVTKARFGEVQND